MSSLVAPLEDAQRRRLFIRIHCEGIEAGSLDGRVLDVSDTTVLLAIVSDAYRANGLTWLRLEDIRAIDFPSPRHDTITRALRLREERLTPRSSLDAFSFASAIEKASQRFGLVAIHSDADDPGSCDVGVMESIDEKHVVLRTIDPDGCWDDDALRIALADVTRVDAGGEYETALALVSKDRAKAKPKKRR